MIYSPSRHDTVGNWANPGSTCADTCTNIWQHEHHLCFSSCFLGEPGSARPPWSSFFACSGSGLLSISGKCFYGPGALPVSQPYRSTEGYRKPWLQPVIITHWHILSSSTARHCCHNASFLMPVPWCQKEHLAIIGFIPQKSPVVHVDIFECLNGECTGVFLWWKLDVDYWIGACLGCFVVQSHHAALYSCAVLTASTPRSIQKWSRRCSENDEGGIDAGSWLYRRSQNNDVFIVHFVFLTIF